MAFIEFKDVSKIYNMGEVEIKAISPSASDIKDGRNMGSRFFSYAHNTSLMGNIDKANAANTIVYKQGWLKTPSKYFAFADSYSYNFSHGNFLITNHRRLVLRHLGKKAINIVFADGHADTIIDERLNYNDGGKYAALINPGLGDYPNPYWKKNLEERMCS